MRPAPTPPKVEGDFGMGQRSRSNRRERTIRTGGLKLCSEYTCVHIQVPFRCQTGILILKEIEGSKS